jgi:hypothetical protein
VFDNKLSSAETDKEAGKVIYQCFDNPLIVELPALEERKRPRLPRSGDARGGGGYVPVRGLLCLITES